MALYNVFLRISVAVEMGRLNNDIQIVGSPWSPPGWMKINGELYGNTTDNNLDDGYGSSRGLGSTGHTHAFAQYFVKYIQAHTTENTEYETLLQILQVTSSANQSLDWAIQSSQIYHLHKAKMREWEPQGDPCTDATYCFLALGLSRAYGI
ncbi:hypothetical protein TSTA_078460 [Talaromyces stipitatus ATCC 10500]|uniref:Glycosyl hydrolase family 30 TIM-barrel domain-containing protein n=1 Tax=Talaromyces stipitatus (strain ATCC 10500 / CBS 375.48 / QM 6759 / NRRL 1006) TaxID=441959 RepID=B8LXI6_TALSN|nr:uncharacterized protein TSTA_078460 [Talaromyces stipitatus ATCC 10500]EED24487.1 hypothetical protein TSTA_078460 [Talaromyces stipitatus ATCC 10500]